jgi:6-phosphogluconate dehydrogenase
MSGKADIGMIGLAVMGENLALNMESRGYKVAVYNRTVPGVEEGVVDRFVSGRGSGKKFTATHSVEDFVNSLARPRKIMMMIKAGKPVDEMIQQLIPYLDAGDIVIDGGNSNHTDTTRRVDFFESKGLRFVGSGVSGGEEGALNGPSLMPGGTPSAWPEIKPIFQAIAAKTDDGSPCCQWIGDKGAGHFVKMVHNGIEYGDMQLIAEAFLLMRDHLHMPFADMQAQFAQWNEGVLDSYLIEITADILKVNDADGTPLVEKIRDSAGQKGTGKWTGINALDLGIPLTLITEAVTARYLSAKKDERLKAEGVLEGPKGRFDGDRESFLLALEQALFAAKIVSYAQGYDLMKAASEQFGWNLNYGDIALTWRGGCIIRSAFLGDIKEAFDDNPQLENLMMAPFFTDKLARAQQGLRSVVAQALTMGYPLPAMASALTYYDGYRSGRLTANMIQAQRDYFGAHTYERLDKPRGEHFHTNWTGKGGNTASTVYTH